MVIPLLYVFLNVLLVQETIKAFEFEFEIFIAPEQYIYSDGEHLSTALIIRDSENNGAICDSTCAARCRLLIFSPRALVRETPLGPSSQPKIRTSETRLKIALWYCIQISQGPMN